MNFVENIILINLKKHINKTGSLVSIDYAKDLNCDIKRSFIVSSTKDVVRGRHAHKKLNQFLVCLNGKCEITCKDGTKEKIYTLNNSNEVLFVPNQIWAEQKYLSNNSVLLVLCDDIYLESDYIRDYKLFKQYRSTLV